MHGIDGTYFQFNQENLLRMFLLLASMEPAEGEFSISTFSISTFSRIWIR